MLSKFNKQVGSNNSKEDGKNFICVGEGTKRLEIFLNLINGEVQITAGRMENFVKINKRVYRISFYLRPKSR